MNHLTCKSVPWLDGVSSAELSRLFPEPSSTAPLLSLLQESGIDGFKLRSIVVLKDDAPILLLPLFETLFNLSTFAEGWIKKPLKEAVRLIPSIFSPHVLGVGLLVGEWSEIGIDPQIDAGTLEAAWKMALGALQTLATELKSDIVAFYNFNNHGKLPGEIFKKFHRAQCPPCARLPITFNSYVLSWLENIRTCVERKILFYNAGQGAEKTKAHLGATFIPSLILFKHRQPVVDRFLSGQPAVIEKILRHLGFWPAVSPLTASDVLV